MSLWIWHNLYNYIVPGFVVNLEFANSSLSGALSHFCMLVVFIVSFLALTYFLAPALIRDKLFQFLYLIIYAKARASDN